MFTTQAEVKVKNSQGQVIASQQYSKQVFHGTEEKDGKVVTGEGTSVEKLLGDAIAFFQKEAGEKGNGVIELLKAATYAHDLDVRAGIRQTLVTAAAGPDKAIEKQIKDFMAARAALGKPVTEEVARTRVMAMLNAD